MKEFVKNHMLNLSQLMKCIGIGGVYYDLIYLRKGAPFYLVSITLVLTMVRTFTRSFS